MNAPVRFLFQIILNIRYLDKWIDQGPSGNRLSDFNVLDYFVRDYVKNLIKYRRDWM